MDLTRFESELAAVCDELLYPLAYGTLRGVLAGNPRDGRDDAELVVAAVEREVRVRRARRAAAVDSWSQKAARRNAGGAVSGRG